jgi:FAD/FMN-containing dehydrogenase
MSHVSYQSWGRLPGPAQAGVRIAPGDGAARYQPLAEAFARSSTPLLAYGNGRSYGDSCFNNDGPVLDMRGFDRILDFDAMTGELEAEPGILLSAILEATVPQGWFLPVTPGTKFVTLGGAIANDVHGKNHHALSTFGAHVLGFEVLRSDGKKHWCSLTAARDLFSATIGGMGLTGIITRARIKMIPIASADIDQIIDPFASLTEFASLNAERSHTHAYTVAWLDTSARGKARGRGLLISGNHAPGTGRIAPIGSSTPKVGVPFAPPIPAINGLTLKAFNTAYFHANRARAGKRRVPFGGFFYPLDAVAGWNKLYGPKGLYQHQSVVPLNALDTVAALLETAERHGQASFLTVLKTFGDVASPGLLSFPKPGLTLTLDFPNRGERTLKLLDELDALVLAVGGRVNPYKDARMAPETFRAGFPCWRDLEQYRDSKIQSAFWRRVTAGASLASPTPLDVAVPA